MNFYLVEFLECKFVEFSKNLVDFVNVFCFEIADGDLLVVNFGFKVNWMINSNY
jgi:hypothetical protein